MSARPASVDSVESAANTYSLKLGIGINELVPPKIRIVDVVILSQYIRLWRGNQVMAKILIRNAAEEHWQQVMDSKLQVMLGSMFGHISRIEITLYKSSDQRNGQSIYNCRLLIRESSGQKHELCNHQPDGNHAVEGAIARGRRALTRLSRPRASAWGQPALQKTSQKSLQ